MKKIHTHFQQFNTPKYRICTRPRNEVYAKVIHGVNKCCYESVNDNIWEPLHRQIREDLLYEIYNSHWGSNRLLIP